MMFSKLSQGSEYNEEDIRSTSSMTEWHYRALQSVGFESNTDADADEKFVSHSVGRTPSVLSLEIDLAEEVDDLPRDLQSGAGAGVGSCVMHLFVAITPRADLGLYLTSVQMI